MRRRHQRGLSLIELLLAVALMAVLVAAVVELPRMTHDAWSQGAQRSELQGNARLGLDYVVRELRQAKSIVQISGSGNSDGFIRYTDSSNVERRFDRRLDAGLGRSVLALDGAAVAEVVDTLVFTGLAADVVTETTSPESIYAVVVSMTVSDPKAVVAPLTVQSTVLVRRDAACTWWDCDWNYRFRVTVTAGSVAVPNGYAVPLTFDHQSLVTAGKAEIDGADLRVVYRSSSGCIELDRVLDVTASWNNSATTIWFKTQALISANSADSGYYVYHGNRAATAAPAAPLNVYLFYDGFGGTALDTSLWKVLRGGPSVAGGVLTVPAKSKLAAQSAYRFGLDTRWEAYVKLGGDGTEKTFNFWCGTNSLRRSGFTDDYIRLYTDRKRVRFQNARNRRSQTKKLKPSSPTAYHTYAFNRENGPNVRYFYDGVQKANHRRAGRVPRSSLRPYIDNKTKKVMRVDWVRIRPYVDPEPSTASGAEELQTCPS